MATIPSAQAVMIEHAGDRTLYLNAVDPSYFPMMRLPLLAGRLFAGKQDAAVISESAARALWPSETPLGKTLLIGGRRRTVAGVVKDSGVNLMTYPESVEAYTPIEDKNAAFATILVHATSNPGPMSAALSLRGHPFRASSRRSSRFRAPSTGNWTRSERPSRLWLIRPNREHARAARHLRTAGLYGGAEDARDGVRMALGARGLDVLRCVLGQYALPFGVGAAFGVAVAAAAAKVLRNVLFGFIPFDLVSFGAGLLLFGAVALAASIAPARRALRIDPASALRYE